MVLKGSVALDGVSLTVESELRDGGFSVSLILETLTRTTLGAAWSWATSSTWRSTSSPSTSSGSWGEGIVSVSRTTVFATIEEALEEIRQGHKIVVVDDEDRENEGDLVMAAQFVTPDAINYHGARGGRGWICLALTPERCDELEASS